MSALPLFRREFCLLLLADLPLDIGNTTVQVLLNPVLDEILGRCGLDGLRRFRCRLCRRIEQRRLTRLHQLGAVAPAAGFAARLGDASFLLREAEQVVKRQKGRLDFGLLLAWRNNRLFCLAERFRHWVFYRLQLLQPSIPNAARIEPHS